MRIIKAGTTSKSIYVIILDSVSTTGGRKTGIAYNTASFTAYYAINGAAATAITLATLASAAAAWATGGFVEVSATNQPGLYRLDLPNAALASGESVVVTLKGAAGMVQCDVEIQLTAIDLQDTVRFGLTAIPNVAQGNAGQLPTAGATGLVTLAAATHTGAVIPTVTTLTGHTAQTGDSFARIGAAGAGLTGVGDTAGTTTILSRLSSARAGYLDNLSAGAVALASSLTSLSGIFTGITSLAQWLGLIAGKQVGNSTARTEIRATGAGSGTYDETTDSNEALKDASIDSATLVDNVFDEVVLGSYTFRQLVRGIASANLGKLSGAATTTVTIRSADDTKNVIVATVDADGNRSAITLDLT